MRSLFTSAGFKSTSWNIGSLSKWNTSKVTNMSYMLTNAGYNSSSIIDFGTLKVYASDISNGFASCVSCKITLNIYSNPTAYTDALKFAAYKSGSKVTVNYSSATTNIDNIMATMTTGNNVVKGSLIS